MFDYSFLAETARKRENDPSDAKEVAKRVSEYEKEFAEAAKRAAPKADLYSKSYNL